MIHLREDQIQYTYQCVHTRCNSEHNPSCIISLFINNSIVLDDQSEIVPLTNMIPNEISATNWAGVM